MEKQEPIDHQGLWDDVPDPNDPERIISADRIGGAPAEGIPGHITISDKSIRTEADLRISRGRFGNFRTQIDGFRKSGLSVGLKVRIPGQVDVFVAEHADSIKKAAVAGAATGVAVAGAVVYMHSHRRRK